MVTIVVEGLQTLCHLRIIEQGKVDAPYSFAGCLMPTLPVQHLALFAAVATDATGAASQQGGVRANGPAALRGGICFGAHWTVLGRRDLLASTIGIGNKTIFSEAN